MLMFIAVDFYKQRNSFLVLIFCMLMFILAGFEHSIADMSTSAREHVLR